MAETVKGPCTIREFDPVDGYFALVSDASGGLFAKAYDKRKAQLIGATPRMFDALISAEVAISELCEGQDAANECWNILRQVRRAIAEAKGAA